MCISTFSSKKYNVKLCCTYTLLFALKTQKRCKIVTQTWLYNLQIHIYIYIHMHTCMYASLNEISIQGGTLPVDSTGSLLSLFFSKHQRRPPLWAWFICRWARKCKWGKIIVKYLSRYYILVSIQGCLVSGFHRHLVEFVLFLFEH